MSHFRGAPHLAPEQARGDLLTGATDVWGIGMVLFEAATGRRAFATGNNGGYPQIEHRAESVRKDGRLPIQLAKAIDSCLEPNPNDRPNVAELSKILTRLT